MAFAKPGLIAVQGGCLIFIVIERIEMPSLLAFRAGVGILSSSAPQL